MINYLSQSPQIREVIISGGDPLILDDHILENFLSSLRAIKHIEVLRLGSRVPVVMPMRITKELCRILKRYRPCCRKREYLFPTSRFYLKALMIHQE